MNNQTPRTRMANRIVDAMERGHKDGVLELLGELELSEEFQGSDHLAVCALALHTWANTPDGGEPMEDFELTPHPGPPRPELEWEGFNPDDPF